MELPKEEQKAMMEEMKRIHWIWRAVSTSVSPSLDIYSVDSLQDKHSLNIIISAKHNRNDKIVETPALIDSGAGGTFINQNHT